RQWRTATQQLEEQRNNFTRVVSEFRTQREPLIRNFVGALHLFATTNADVRPLLEKFRPALEAYYPPTLRPAVGPASAPPASEPSK
ncbi:MAG TPA: hypothetical protein VNO52_07390, partial [Methylomirabilota bacterium]|nr:hypothetical protein [Methylomirabilota bacterium]